MPVLSVKQITQYAYNAGFRGDALNQAVAIALAESGGNTASYNPESAAGGHPKSGSRGLWQIYGTAHPEFNNSKTFDPQVNANAAFKVFREAGNRFTPWSTFNLGMQKKFLKNYSSLVSGPTKATPSGSQKASPVATVARGSSEPMTQNQPVSGGGFEGATAGAEATATTPTLKSFLGLEPAASLPAPMDILFIIIGVSFLLIGIWSLVGLGTGKVIYDNKESIAKVAKLAAL